MDGFGEFVTAVVILVCFFFGGLGFGYEAGRSAGVEAMGGMKTMGHAVRPAANLSHEVVGRMRK